ncbi:MAG: hypothetical protein AAF383_22150 [Cyanobacteria bacterium P01_A01_bin.83]
MSDKNMDDLLAQLKNEFEPGAKVNSKANKSPASKPPSPQSTASQASMDQMLAELRADLESGRVRTNRTPEKPKTFAKPDHTRIVNSKRDRDLLNALIDTDYRRQAHKRELKLAEIKRKQEAELAEIKRREEIRIAEEKRRQQELIELQKRKELRERKRKEALREEAKEWLVELDPRSEEGKWFEEFSYSYENKLQAAIDYLEAMRETGL